MTKKELEEMLANKEDELSFDLRKVDEAKQRLILNVKMIDEYLAKEKNKEKQKLFTGLKEEFGYIYDILDLIELPF